MSIRRTSDGHSFSCFPPEEAQQPGDAPVEVEVLTPGTLLVPAEVFAQEAATELLAAAGITCRADERIVTSDPTAPAIALMTLDETTARAIDTRFGSRVRYTTPLCDTATFAEPTVWMRRTAELLYIKVYDGGLQFAEVVPAADEAGMEYLFERLSAVFPLAKYTLRCTDDAGRRPGKRLRNRFKKTICE